MRLDGKLALVTGASSGLGRALAEALAQAGCDLALTARDRARLHETAAPLRASGRRVEIFPHDIAQGEETASLLRAVEARLGPVSILVNNAGMGVGGAVEDIPLGAFEDCLRVNLLGAVALTQAALPGMRSRTSGAIVMVSSGVALRAIPGHAPYCAAKAGLSAFAESLRVELRGTGVVVTTVYPGAIGTDFNRNTRYFGAPVLPVHTRFAPADRVAAKVVSAIRRNEPFAIMRGPAWAAWWLSRFAPRLVDRILAARLKPPPISPTHETAKRAASFVVPALNEEKNIADTVAEIVKVGATLEDYEIVLVDDGSTDRTGPIMDALAAANTRIVVMHNATNMGLGGAYKVGVACAAKPYVMMIPGDNNHPAEGIVPILSRLGLADIIVPYVSNPEARSPLRRLISGTFTRLLNTLFGLSIPYYNGLVVHRTALVQGIDIETNSHAYQAEALVKLVRRGATVVSVAAPVAHTGDRNSRAFRPRNIRAVADTIWRLLIKR